MTDGEVMELSAQRLIEVRSALAALKEKRLPSADAEMLVASMYQMLRSRFELYDEVVKKLQKLAQQANETEDAAEKKALRLEMEQKADELAAQTFIVRKPKTRIAARHLPQAHKGKDGDENPTGNAAVIIALGPEFYEGFEEA